MPELPEVEIVKRSLSKIANKAKIIDIKIKNKNLRYKIPKFFKKKLLNHNILRVSRRSKYIIFHFKNKFLLLHLGMTGKLLFFKKKYTTIFKTSFYHDLNILPKHNHIFFILSNNLTLVYNDVRRFGFFKIYENKKLNEISFLSKLGVEPLNKKLNYKYFKKIIKNRKKNIKNILMDQTLICGLGNIYVSEALFLAKINPLRLSYSLKNREIKNIIKNIKLILKLSIAKGGSSIKDFKNTFGKNGKFQQYFNVYGRNNKNCSRTSCTGEIKKILISNRSSFYCSSCQK